MLAGFVPTSAAAQAPVASYTTRGCDTGIQWNVGYRLYFRDSTGRVTTRDALPGMLSEAEKFADAVGRGSGCQARMRIDVFDMGDELWSPTNGDAPAAAPAFIDASGYDAAFFRHPLADENYFGRAYPGDFGRLSTVFPVGPDGTGPGCTTATCGRTPHDMLLMHEWLHLVVAFYEPSQGWPSNDVHGGREHGYCESTTRCSQVYEPYFADMMQGKVLEGGQARGMLPADWQRDGSPKAPRRASSPAWTASPVIGNRARGDGDALRLNIPAGYDGTAEVELRVGGQAPTIRLLGAGSHAFPVAEDSYLMLCVTLPGTQKYRRGGQGCTSAVLLRAERCVVPSVANLKLDIARARISDHHCAVREVRSRLLTAQDKRRGRRPGTVDPRLTSTRPGISTVVLPGATLDSGAPLTVTLRKASCTVPALRNLTVAKARAALMRAGCRLGRVTRRTVTHARATRRGRVASSSPGARQVRRAGASVRLTVRAR